MSNIIIVSGIVRSGTSMVMQMLEKGGVDCIYDNNKSPDDFNPNGYYLNKDIRNFGNHKHILERADGKALKLFANIVRKLPLNHNYKIIFIHRDVLETLNSYKRMTLNNKDAVISSYPTKQILKKDLLIKNVLQWIHDCGNSQLLELNYSDVLHDPMLAANQITEFLGVSLDKKAMAKVVDPNLRHVNRSTLEYVRTDRAPLGVAEVINEFVKNKTYCEIGIGEGHLLNLIKDAKFLFGIEKTLYGVERSKLLYPHIEVIHGDFFDHHDKVEFDVAYLWIIYPICKEIIDSILAKKKDTIIISGMTYYYHLDEADAKRQKYIKNYPKTSNAATWNESIDLHFQELKEKGFDIEIRQIIGDHNDIFSVAIIQHKGP